MLLNLIIQPFSTVWRAFSASFLPLAMKDSKGKSTSGLINKHHVEKTKRSYWNAR